ncbi:MAG: MFS transporter [Chloroflexi bacterium]|nr:MFS transporter [Chloroflexota bacterium]
MSNLSAAVSRGLRNYGMHLAGFSRNARLYLLGAFITSIGLRIVDVVFNFYLVSLGHRADFVGQMASLLQGVIFVIALPASIIAVRIGLRRALAVSTVLIAAALFGLTLVVAPEGIALMLVLYGAGLAIMVVAMLPFLMENSTPAERTHLFSMNQAAVIGAGFAGGFIGGNAPQWAASLGGFHADSPQAYQEALAVAACFVLVSLGGLVLMSPGHSGRAQVARRAFSGVRADWRLIVKILIPNLLISLGAGLLIPFNNLFARTRYALTDAQVGTIFALMSLMGGIAIVTGPVLANRFGRIRTVVLTQAVSVVMLVLLGFSPWAWLGLLAFMLRPGLMQMSGPLFDAFSMEHVHEDARASLSSLNQMMWTFGMMVASPLSGRVQLEYGWEPIIAVMTAAYVLGIGLQYVFFARQDTRTA